MDFNLKLIESIGTTRLWFISVSLVVCFTIGGFGNVISMIIFNNKLFKKQTTTVYLQASFLFSLFILLYTPVMYLAPLWIVNSNNCKIYTGILAIITEIKAWIQAMGSLDRLISVLKPHKFLFKNKLKNQAILMFSIAFVLILLTLPGSIFFTSMTFKNKTICSFPIQEDLKWISIYSGAEYFCFRTILPFLIMLTSSGIISWTMYKNKNHLIPNVDRKREINLFKSLISIDLFIMIFQIPSFIQIFQSSSANYFNTLEYSIFFSVSLISNVFLFLVFMICNRVYRNLFFKYIKFFKNNIIVPF